MIDSNLPEDSVTPEFMRVLEERMSGVMDDGDGSCQPAREKRVSTETAVFLLAVAALVLTLAASLARSVPLAETGTVLALLAAGLRKPRGVR